MVLGVLAGLGASFAWALGPLIAEKPARLLGAFELTRIQLISSFAILLALVTSTVGWSTILVQHASAYAVAIVVGVILGNLAMLGCLRRGGAQRTELLFAMNTPIAAGLGYLVLGETLSAQQFLGIGLGIAGVMLAISYGKPAGPASGNGPDFRHMGPLSSVIALGLAAAFCNAIGLIALRPVLTDGAEPLAVTAIRTGGAALVMVVVALWPAKAFQSTTQPTLALTVTAIIPGVLGYVIAVCLQLYALRIFNTGTAALLGSAAPIMILPMIWIARRQRPRPASWGGAALVVIGAGLTIGAL